MTPATLGAIVNAALFLGGTLAASLVAGNHFATVTALISAGSAALAYANAASEKEALALPPYTVSHVAAWAAGVSLLVGYFI